MDKLPNVGDMVCWHDERLNRKRFGTVVQNTNNHATRVRTGDGRVVLMDISDVEKAF